MEVNFQYHDEFPKVPLLGHDCRVEFFSQKLIRLYLDKAATSELTGKPP